MLYSFFRVIPRRLSFVCRQSGTLCLFHLQLTFEKAARVEGDGKARQNRKLLRLHGTQRPPKKISKETVINLSDQTQDDEVYSLLQNSLNYAVTPGSTPIEDILAESDVYWTVHLVIIEE